MVNMIRDMVSGTWERIVEWFSPAVPVKEDFKMKTLMKFDRNTLFKGHQGSICTFQGDICLYNQYYEASTHQRVDGKDVHIKIQQEFTNPKWLESKIEKLHTLLKTLQYENMPDNSSEFVMYHQGMEFHIMRHYAHVSKKYVTDVDNMLGHWDSIQIFRKMKRLYPILRQKFKEMSVEQIAEMASELHHEGNETWIIHPNILQSSTNNGTT